MDKVLFKNVKTKDQNVINIMVANILTDLVCNSKDQSGDIAERMKDLLDAIQK